MTVMEQANIRPRGRPRGFGAEATRQMIRLYNDGATMKELAERYGVNVSVICRTLHRANKENAPATDQDHTGLVYDVENRQGDDTP